MCHLHGTVNNSVPQVLGDNLLALIKAFDYRGIPLPVVRRLARQILVALDHIHSGPRIIHTDLKPENVMLREALSPRKWRALANAAPPAAGAQGLWAACITVRLMKCLF